MIIQQVGGEVNSSATIAVYSFGLGCFSVADEATAGGDRGAIHFSASLGSCLPSPFAVF